MSNIKIDFTETKGKMKPMHGMNAGTLTKYFTCDAREIFREAGIPITRLHDAEYPYGRGEFVDIPCIFKNFDADVDDPASYNFDFTDQYLKAIDDAGTKIMYRLGVSIEHYEIKRNIFPPKDYLKWAKICEHVIRHYNEGWANGMHLGIEYWEIWTEPNHCYEERPLMWAGTMAEFGEFYTVSATYLKNCFPDLKIGGPAMSSPASKLQVEFFEEITKNGNHPPLDFYSWHGYVNSVEAAVQRCKDAEAILNKYGYGDSESIYNEWNFVKSWSEMRFNASFITSYKCASFNAAMMAAMQNEHCDMLNCYSAEGGFIGTWNSMFSLDTSGERSNGQGSPLKKLKGFYAFKAFNEIYKKHNQVNLTSDDERLYGVASFENGKGAFYISSFAPVDEELNAKEVHIELKGAEGKKATVYVIDESSDLTKTVTFDAASFDYLLPPYSVIFVEVE